MSITVEKIAWFHSNSSGCYLLVIMKIHFDFSFFENQERFYTKKKFFSSAGKKHRKTEDSGPFNFKCYPCLSVDCSPRAFFFLGTVTRIVSVSSQPYFLLPSHIYHPRSEILERQMMANESVGFVLDRCHWFFLTIHTRRRCKYPPQVTDTEVNKFF